MKLFKIFLPFVTKPKRAFDHSKLIPLMQKLFVDASNYPACWAIMKYDDDWTFGFMTTGNTVISLIYIQHISRKPTTDELKEVIDALPVKYCYSIDDLIPEIGENKLKAILNSET